MHHDLTNGNITRSLLWFAFPIMVGNLLQQFYNIADSIIAGQFLGVNALAAIGSTGSLMFFVTGWLQGLTSGFAILVSQWFGAKDMKRMRHYVAMSIYLTIAFAVVMTIGFEFANEPILRLMNSPENLMADIKGYMAVIYGGLIVTAAYNALAAVLRALGDSKSPLYFLIISAIINVVLDIVFIVNFGMGVEGCGYATVIAQAVSALLCLIYIVKKFPILRLSEEDFRISFQSMGRLLALGIPMGLQYSITAIGSVILQASVNTLGSMAVAAVAAGSKVTLFFCCPFDALGGTMATYAGQNVGAGKLDRIKAGLKSSSIIGCIYAVIAFLILVFFSDKIALLFMDAGETETIRQVSMFLIANSAFYIPLVFVNVVRFTIQGMGYSTFAILAGVFEMAARGLAGLVLVPAFGYIAACFGSPLAWIFADIFLFPAFFHCLKTMKRELKEAKQ